MSQKNGFRKSVFGFSLMEVMMVVAIIGILAAVALPSYQSYANKAAYADVVSAAVPARTEVDICVQTRGADQCEAIPAQSGWAVSELVDNVSITVDEGVFLVTVEPSTARAGIDGDDSYILSGTPQGGSLQWRLHASSGCLASGLC